MTTEEMTASLAVVRDKRFELGDHTVTEEEIIDVVDWVSQKKRSFALTDLGNAERFVDLFGSSEVLLCMGGMARLGWTPMGCKCKCRTHADGSRHRSKSYILKQHMPKTMNKREQ